MISLTSSIYLWCLVGIVISTILPILWQYVRAQFPLPKGMVGEPRAGLSELFVTMKPYLALCLASALTAVLLVAFLGDNLTDARAAILAGYAWDSTLQKLK